MLAPSSIGEPAGEDIVMHINVTQLSFFPTSHMYLLVMLFTHCSFLLILFAGRTVFQVAPFSMT